MIPFPTTNLKVQRGLTYNYIHIPPSQPSKQYILFLHGFPSLPTDFTPQINHLHDTLGHGILAPSLPGYGLTSHPEVQYAYLLSHICDDLIFILDHHKIVSVHGVGHDWGATLLSRLEFYHPTRVTSMAFLTIGVAALGQPFDLDAVNAMTKEKLGYEGFGYMEFMAREPDAADLINTHQTSFRSLVFAADAELWKQHFGALGGLRAWLENDKRAETLDDYSGLEREHEEAFAMDRDGYTGTLNWYKNHVSGANTSQEATELARRGRQPYQVEAGKAVLQLLAGRDPIALADMHRQMTKAYAPHAVVKQFNTGHWVMLEAREEVIQELQMFFAGVEGTSIGSEEKAQCS